MILDKIVKKRTERIKQQKEKLPLNELIQNIDLKNIKNSNHSFPFEKALKREKKSDISIIAEVKRASPSKGLIAENFNPIEIAKEYEKSGTSAISVLTEPDFFKGKNEYITEIAKNITIPILRKDFIIDEYMIYEAKIIGASAILLIVSILKESQLKNYIEIANNLGLSALIEAHNEEEIKIAINCGARIIGVNNRNLKDFTVNLNNSINLRKLVPKDLLFVSESGIKTPQDIKKLKDNDIDAVLIGESLMKSNNKKEMINSFKNA
ncbi:MAG: indole-3-glycerol phosphate synthase TrpC [Methanobrevibacter sp.]|nr:indole-3-glycerol phosphate synthase TrpC [Candidatus Methanoflexus mossambicus]